MRGRYEFHGKGKDLYKAVVKAHRFMPKRFVDVSAKKFLEHPESTVLKVHGLNQKWNLNSILGYSDTETVKLDFDNTPFRTVRYWALRTMQWHKLEGFLIFKSSENSYHVVFNRKVSWSENMKIVAWVSLLSGNKTLQKWLLMQCIKESSTLRMSPKKEKPSPRIVFRHGRQDKQIQNFLQYRKLIKNMIRRTQLHSLI